MFHGLPVFPCNPKGLHAIVVGASGIFVFRIFREALKRWRKVSALSRRLPNCQGFTIQDVCVDLVRTPAEIAQGLRSDSVRG